MQRISLAATIALVGAALLSAPALASGPTVIFSEVPGLATSQVPGLALGVEFDEFDRPYRSPDGNSWIISASSNLATTEDEVIIIGFGPSYVGSSVVVREGTPAAWTGGAENVGFIDRNLGLNNAGQYAFATNTNGPTTADEYIVTWNGASFAAAAQEGQPVPGVAGEIFGSTLNSPHILNNGTAGYRATLTVGGLPTAQDDFLFLGNTMVAQSGVTVPSGQAGGATEVWGAFDSQDYYHSADGTSNIILGDLAGATTGDDVVVVNGVVVVQEDSILAGMASPVNTIREVAMSSNGDWLARGGNDDLADWIIMNGATLAMTGDDVPGTGGTEHYDDSIFSATFFQMTGNNNGDFVLGATTDFADPDFDAVLVFNGTDVVARQGDPIDLDGNGLFDDDAFINTFNNDDGFLTDDLHLYFTADLKNGAGTSLGQAFMVMVVPEPATLTLLALAALPLMRRRRHG